MKVHLRDFVVVGKLVAINVIVFNDSEIVN